MCCANCCKAKNNASFRGSLIRFLKFVLEATGNWDMTFLLLRQPEHSGIPRVGFGASQATQTSSLIGYLSQIPVPGSLQKSHMLRLVRLYGA